MRHVLLRNKRHPSAIAIRSKMSPYVQLSGVRIRRHIYDEVLRSNIAIYSETRPYVHLSVVRTNHVYNDVMRFNVAIHNSVRHVESGFPRHFPERVKYASRQNV